MFKRANRFPGYRLVPAFTAITPTEPSRLGLLLLALLLAIGGLALQDDPELGSLAREVGGIAGALVFLCWLFGELWKASGRSGAIQNLEKVFIHVAFYVGFACSMMYFAVVIYFSAEMLARYLSG